MMAWLISSFNLLEDTSGPDHDLVQLLLQKWKVLKISDDRVPQMGNEDQDHEILRRWSQHIQDNFDNDMSRRLLSKSTGPDQISGVLCSEVRRLADEQKRIHESMSEIAAAVNKLNNSAKLMEQNRLLTKQVMTLIASKNKYKNELQRVMGIMSPNLSVQNHNIETKVKDSVRGQLHTRMLPNERRPR